MSEIIIEKETRLIELIKNNKELEPYFFQRLALKKDIKWLEVLKKRGFFDNKNIPVAKEDEYLENWDILNYVKSILNQLIDDNRKDELDYIREVLLQAAEISSNFRVFQQSIDILTQIPTNMYDEKYLKQLLYHWLNCKFLTNHTLHHLFKFLLPILAEHDIEKSQIVFKVLLEKFADLDDDKSFIFSVLISNDEMLSNISSTNFDNVIKMLISLLEDRLYCESSEKSFGDVKYKLNRRKSEYIVLRDNIKIAEGTFQGRTKDIVYLLDLIRVIEKEISEEELEKNVKLLYGNLYIKSAFESIFADKEYYSQTEDYLIALIIKFLKLKNCMLNEDQLESILKNEYDLIKKLGLYVISERLDLFKGYLLKQIKERKDYFDFILRYYIYEDEIKHIFERIIKLEDQHIQALEEIIESGEYIKHGWSAEVLNIWKQKMYTALKNIPQFNDKYEHLKNITGMEVSLSPAIGFCGVYSIEEKSQITEEEALQMSNEELYNNMIGFRQSKEYDENFSRITYGGFNNILKKVIKKQPERFIYELNKFDKIQYEFFCNILDAFKELINEGKIKKVDKIIEFINTYISSNSFWEDEYCYENDKKYYMNHQETLKQVLRFITECTHYDRNSFDIKEYLVVLDILKLIPTKINLNKLEEVLFSNNDVDLYSLNSIGGIYIRSLISVALLAKKKNFSNYQVSWEKDIKPIYEKCLDEGCRDAYFLTGQLYSNLAYLDGEWTINKFKSITSDNELWEFFVAGYLYSRVVSSDYFELMKDNLEIALKYNFVDEDVKRRLSEHITFAYLNGFDKYNLFEELISLGNEELLSCAIRTCCSLDKKNFVQGIEMAEVKNKTLNLWTNIRTKYEKILKDTMNVDEKKLISESIMLINNFEFINSDINNNIRFCFKYLKHDFNYYSLVEFFAKFINEYPCSSSLTELNLIKDFLKEVTPTYPEESIKKILRYLNIDKEYIKEIASLYMKGGPGTMNIVKYISSELLK